MAGLNDVLYGQTALGFAALVAGGSYCSSSTATIASPRQVVLCLASRRLAAWCLASWRLYIAVWCLAARCLALRRQAAWCLASRCRAAWGQFHGA
jgi:hypothetical protein